MSEKKSEIVPLLRQYMLQKNISANEVHRRTGLSIAHLSHIFNRHINPRVDVVERIADSIGVVIIVEERDAPVDTV